MKTNAFHKQAIADCRP